MARSDDVLLISCLGEQTGGGLFAFDGDRLEQLDTLSSTGLALTGDRVGRLLWSSGEAGSVGELLVYDESGITRYFRIDALREPHDLAWDGEAFVAVSTMSNSLVWLDASGEVIRTWQAEGDGDAWHLNSLVVAEERLVAAAFGRFSRHREWSEARLAGRGIVFDLETGEDLVAGLDCPHDPRLLDGLWLVCNSARRELVGVDPASGAVVRRAELDGWTRGLEVGEECLYVGESANRADPLADGLASVAVIDRETWSIVDRLQVPCQEVFDVMRVPAPLVAGVRRGFRTNALRVAEQDQHALFAAAGVQPARLWAIGEPLPVSACRIRVQATVPAQLEADSHHEWECLVANEGTAIFVSAPPHPVHLSYRWVARDDPKTVIEGTRTRLPEAIPPGGELRCVFSVRAPSTPAEYDLVVTLVQEEVAWFDRLDERNALRARVRVTSSPPSVGFEP
jgi:acetolactate synthase I/II/III large subunit